MRRNSRASVWRAISATVPASSTPVGPPPTTRKVNQTRRAEASVSRSALSKATNNRRRISSASSMLLRPGAWRAQASWPKYEWVAPVARIK